MRNILRYMFALLLAGTILSCCTSYDDYKKYVVDGSRIYPQKPDSLKAFPGHNRIMLQWEIIDPKISSCVVSWLQDGERKTLNVPINWSNPAFDDTVRVMIDNLDEASYVFNVISYDDDANRSLTTEVEELAYGDVYNSSLLNRLLKNKQLDGTVAKIDWYGAESSEIGVKLMYKNLDGKQVEKIIPPDEVHTELPDFDGSQLLTYQALYKPAVNAIDTFYSPVETAKFPFAIPLKNPGNPFEMDGVPFLDGRFGNLKDWIVNDVAKVNGTVDNNKGNGMAIWVWSGYSPVAEILNGKIYQTVALSAGEYQLEVITQSLSADADFYNVYIVVNEGDDGLPDVDKMDVALATYKLTGSEAAGTKITVPFTLTAPTIVSLGMVASLNWRGEACLRSFELWSY